MITTFQAVVYSIAKALGEFYLLGSSSLETLIHTALGWDFPDSSLKAALNFGAMIAILIYFRHDWASIFSSFLQVLLFRKRPQTFDENLSFFLILSAVPALALQPFLPQIIGEAGDSRLIAGAVLVVSSMILLYALGRNKKNRNIFAWSYTDAFGVGLCQVFHLIPGGSALFASITYASFRNYHPEAMGKFTALAFLPLLLVDGIECAREATVVWNLTFIVSLIVSTLASLLFLGALLNGLHKTLPRNIAVMRVLIGVALLVLYFFTGN